jgi:hypothetical protein
MWKVKPAVSDYQPESGGQAETLRTFQGCGVIQKLYNDLLCRYLDEMEELWQSKM